MLCVIFGGVSFAYRSQVEWVKLGDSYFEKVNGAERKILIGDYQVFCADMATACYMRAKLNGRY